MSVHLPSLGYNALMSRLAPSSRAALYSMADFVQMPCGFNLARQGEPIDYVYFPTSGIASVTLAAKHGRTAQVGMVGHEGFAPIAVAAGSERSCWDIEMLAAGAAYRIDRLALADAMEKHRSLERLLAAFAVAFSAQLSSTTLSNAVNLLVVRLARWLLMCRDRIWTDRIDITHDHIAVLLGARRASVTLALHQLEGEGLIRAMRGTVVIRDRARLIAFAGEAYGGPEEEYNRLIPKNLRCERYSTAVREPGNGD